MTEYTPFEKGYWQELKPDRTRRSNDSFDEIYSAIGHATDAWEMTQENLTFLFQILCDLIGSQSARPVLRAFGSMEDLGSKIKALEAAAEVYFGTEWEPRAKKPFANVMACLKLAGHRRNEIAHGRVQRFVKAVQVKGKLEMIDWGLFISAPNYKTSRNDLNFKPTSDPLVFETTSHYLFTSADVNQFTFKYRELHHYLGRFINRVAGAGPNSLSNGIDDLIAEVQAKENLPKPQPKHHTVSKQGAERMRGSGRRKQPPNSPEKL